jgi:hypothetical protein
MPEAIQQKIRLEFLNRGILTASELRQATGVSQPTISRALAGIEGLLRIGSGPTTRYALTGEIAGCGSSWPLFVIGRDGEPDQIARLHTLAGGRNCWVERIPGKWESLFHGDFGAGLFPGLPWFLHDARPRGFLGRAYGRRFARLLASDPDPSRWPDRVILEAMIRFGHDLPGAFAIGREALGPGILSDPRTQVPLQDRAFRYLELAGGALAGELVGSSAEGEQPKFSVVVRDGEEARHVIVKFSPPTDTPSGQRWADLLVAEHIAGEMLQGAGFQVPRTEIFDFGGRRFLEIERFDRVGRIGRVPVVTLRTIDAAFCGDLRTWPATARQLLAEGWITGEDAGVIERLWNFGSLIANSDMHGGNLSLVLSPTRPLALAPIYDMLPMAYRPGIEGALPAFGEVVHTTEGVPSDTAALALARRFWGRVAEDARLSEAFQAIARQHARRS